MMHGTFRIVRARPAAAVLLAALLAAAASLPGGPPPAAAQSSDMLEDAADSEPDLSQSLLFDMNGDGIVSIDAFGDSLTRGTGDFNLPGQSISVVTTPAGEAGYPLRLELRLGLPVANLGKPGERLTTGGLFRFASLVPDRRPDIVIISGGSNDSFEPIGVNDYGRALQTMINIARASGVQVVLAGISPVCCDRRDLGPFVESYNRELRLRARVNEVPLADIDRAYRNTCNVPSCSLLNLPEGLHPNEVGYDVDGEVVTAALLGIDIFNPAGQVDLATVLGIAPTEIITVPDPLLPAAPAES